MIWLIGFSAMSRGLKDEYIRSIILKAVVRDYSAPGPHVYTKKNQTKLAYIDILVNLKIRLDSVKRMTQIQNTS